MAEKLVTDSMIQAAIKKAIELGMASAHPRPEIYARAWENLAAIIEAALDKKGQ